MTYEEFIKFVPAKCMYETIYEDSEGREILVISLLQAYSMVNKAQRKWQGLTSEDYQQILKQLDGAGQLAAYNLIEAKLKEKNS